MLLALLAAVTVTFHPARPTVGDPIAIEFAAPATLDPSKEYELVETKGNRVVVRTFTPKPLVLSGTTDGVRFQGLRIPVVSVLAKDDKLQPAPLAPPRPEPWPVLPWYAIGIAAFAAVAVWTAAYLRGRAPSQKVVSRLSPVDVFRREVDALRRDPARKRRWAGLADATRAFLAATRPALGSELTTSEVLPRLRDRDRVVETILRQGDLEKFSPRGPASIEFESVASDALVLVEPEAPEPEAAP
jgi:hypothetical protein